ncbi:hypothetical protein [uncultured Polaribacter sp.]|nr:hypothetical protein [uncultured Polaribacter sp.]
MDNNKLFLDLKSYKSDLKRRGGYLGVFLVLIGISAFGNLKREKYFETIFHYLDFGFRIIGMIAIVLIIYNLFFLKKSKKNLIINEIIKINLDKEEFETELTLVFSDKREQDLSFRNLENQIEPFLDDLKKRNSRIIVKNI